MSIWSFEHYILIILLCFIFGLFLVRFIYFFHLWHLLVHMIFWPLDLFQIFHLLFIWSWNYFIRWSFDRMTFDVVVICILLSGLLDLLTFDLFDSFRYSNFWYVWCFCFSLISSSELFDRIRLNWEIRICLKLSPQHLGTSFNLHVFGKRVKSIYISEVEQNAFWSSWNEELISFRRSACPLAPTFLQRWQFSRPKPASSTAVCWKSIRISSADEMGDRLGERTVNTVNAMSRFSSR